MDAAQRTKIETGVLNCLDECRAADQPYSRLTAFIEGLKANPNWTSEEIIELQTQVIRSLLFSHGLRGNLALAAPQPVTPPRQSWLGLSLLAVLLLLLVAVLAAATFIGGGFILRSQFRGLREQREEAMKALRQPPRLVPPEVEPLEAIPSAEPAPPPNP